MIIVPCLPFCHETPNQLSGLAYHFEEKGPQGTGTDMSHIPDDDSNGWEPGTGPDHQLQSRMAQARCPRTRWPKSHTRREIKKDLLSATGSMLLEPEPKDRKDSEPTLQVLLPKPEDEGGMVSKLKSEVPPLKPEQEGQGSQEPKAQGVVLKPESEISESSQEAEAPALVLQSEPETVKNRGGASAQGLVLKPEGKQRKSPTPECDTQGPSAQLPPVSYDHVEGPPEMNQACLHLPEEFREFAHKGKQDGKKDLQIFPQFCYYIQILKFYTHQRRHQHLFSFLIFHIAGVPGRQYSLACRPQ